MLSTFITAVAGMTVIACSWLAVQRLWQRQFPEYGDGSDDALAGRSGCHGCNCAPNQCERETAKPTHTTEEGSTHAP